MMREAGFHSDVRRGYLDTNASLRDTPSCTAEAAHGHCRIRNVTALIKGA